VFNANVDEVRHGLPAGLDKWLVPVEGEGVARDIATLQVSLGPNGTYFAYDKDGQIWDNLPVELNSELQKARDSSGVFLPGRLPVSVSFGPDGSFVYIDQNGGASWAMNLEHQAPSLWEFLKFHPHEPMVRFLDNLEVEYSTMVLTKT